MCREAKRIQRISTGWHTALRVSESTLQLLEGKIISPCIYIQLQIAIGLDTEMRDNPNIIHSSSPA